MAAISLRGINKRYGNTLALDEVHLECRSGSLTALVGRSGCGKSTLLRTCNGLVRPDTGQVHIGGIPLDYQDLPHQRRTMGYAVQGTGLLPHLTIHDNIALLARLEGWPAADITLRVDELLALTQLPPGLLGRFPHELSGGQQQRVGICRAMMLRPGILLLDEPFAAIDPLTRADIHRHLLALQAEEPCTTLLVTHDLQEALRLADTLVVMDAGRILHQLRRDELPAGDPEAALLALIPEDAG